MKVLIKGNVRGDIIGGDKITHAKPIQTITTRMLFLCAYSDLDLAQEQTQLMALLRHQTNVQTVMDATLRDIQNYLIEKWDYIHLAGHAGEQGFRLKGTHEAQIIPPTLLAQYVKMANPRLLFINACAGGTIAEVTSLAAPETNIIYSEIDISDKAAIESARIFYHTYFNSNDLAQAFTLANLTAETTLRWRCGKTVV